MATLAEAEAYRESNQPPGNPDRRFRVIDGIGWEQDGEPGNELGYHFVPAESFEADTPLHSWLAAYSRGLGRASINLLRYHLGRSDQSSWPIPERITRTINGHERQALITDRQTGSQTDGDESMNMVLAPGLFETDMGSAYRLHLAMAERYPGRCIATLLTPGISIGGALLGINDGLKRTIEETAAENFELARSIVGDEPTDTDGTSFGTNVTTHMAALNLSKDSHKQLNIKRVKLFSPAVGVKHVDWDEVDRPPQTDASDSDLVDKTAIEFYKHMPLEGLKMGLRHPEGAGEVVAAGADYLFAPQKIIRRAATIAGNIRAAKQGIEYEAFRDVGQAYDVQVLGGELCPLFQATIPQYEALMDVAPRTMLWIVKGVGHAMTLNARAVAETSAQMDQAAVKLQLAA